MKILLGSIVTQMAGSVAGQTVRRFRGGFVLHNKLQYRSKFTYIHGSRLPLLTAVFSRWSALSDDARALWNYEATLFQFTDRFGNLKNISGRELFVKLNSQALSAGLAVPDVEKLSGSFLDWSVSFIGYDPAPSVLKIGFDVPAETAFYSIGALPMKSLIRNVDPARAPIIQSGNVTGTSVVNILPDLLKYYPSAVIGQTFRVVVWQLNGSGFKSAPQWFDFQIE